MNKEQIIPQSYIPTNRIVLCSNKISNYRYLISDNGFIPLLIGQGEILRIWLFAKTPDKNVITLVDDNISNLPQIKVNILKAEKIIEIKDIQNQIVILRIELQQIPTINLLDLRPLGYNIFGDSAKLVVGNSTVSGNSFNSVNTIIGFN